MDDPAVDFAQQMLREIEDEEEDEPEEAPDCLDPTVAIVVFCFFVWQLLFSYD